MSADQSLKTYSNAEIMREDVCSRCGGKGYYVYGHNHSKPCEQCCKHDAGWWELTEHHAGYLAGSDNGCCRAGCMRLRRELHQSNADDAPSPSPEQTDSGDCFLSKTDMPQCCCNCSLHVAICKSWTRKEWGCAAFIQDGKIIGEWPEHSCGCEMYSPKSCGDTLKQ